MSLILDTLRRRKEAIDPPAGLPREPVDAAPTPTSSAPSRSVWTRAHVVIYILFLVILAVCGWVLFEWLLASHYNLVLP